MNEARCCSWCGDPLEDEGCTCELPRGEPRLGCLVKATIIDTSWVEDGVRKLRHRAVLLPKDHPRVRSNMPSHVRAREKAKRIEEARARVAAVVASKAP